MQTIPKNIWLMRDGEGEFFDDWFDVDQGPLGVEYVLKETCAKNLAFYMVDVVEDRDECRLLLREVLARASGVLSIMCEDWLKRASRAAGGGE